MTQRCTIKKMDLQRLMQQAQQSKYAQLMKELEAKYQVKRAQLIIDN